MEKAGAPAYLLMISGVLSMIYSVIYGLWSLLVIVPFMMSAVQRLVEGAPPGDVIIGTVMINAVPAVQVLAFIVVFVIGLVTAFGGLRLNSYRSKGLVWLAVLGSTGAPALGLLVNAGSALNLGACGMGCITGCLLANIPTALLLVIGLVSSGFAAFHMTQPEVAERWS